MKFVKYFLMLGIVSLLFGQPKDIVSTKTAYLISNHKYEIGLFQPLRVKISDKMEMSTHPLIFFVSPNLQMKTFVAQWNNFQIASEHNLYYPTPLLKMISREGTGGIIAAEFKDDFPHMFSFYNGLLASQTFAEKYILSYKVGFNFAVSSGDLDYRTSIDLPIIYQRLQVFYDNYGLQYGASFTGPLYKNIYYETAFKLFQFPSSNDPLALEHSTFFTWNKSPRFEIGAGYKLVIGEYPFGSQVHLLPMFDMKWKIK